MTIVEQSPEVVVGTVHQPEGPRSGRRTRSTLTVAIVVLLAAAGAITISALGSPVDDGILVSDAEGTLSLLRPDSPEPVYELDNAVATADRSRVYQTTEDARFTTLNERRVDDGALTASTAVGPPGLEIRIVSPDGDAVALMPRSTGDVYTPEPRDETTIVVVRDGLDAVTHELEGNFEPEAFTADGTVLYLLEYWPAMSPDRYFVRSMDVESGAVTDTNGPEVDLNPEMRGHARAQVIAPDGGFLYTLYTLDQVGVPVADPDGQDRWAFVHVISLTEDWSFCVFLPPPMGQWESSIGLAVSPDGRTVHAVDSAAGLIAEIDTAALEVTRTAPLGVWAPEAGRVPTAVGPDGRLFLAIDGLVVAYDPGTLETTGTWGWSDERIHDLDVAPDGRTLRASVGGHVRLYDLTTNEQISSISLSTGSTDVDFIGTPQGPRSFITKGGQGDPLACAC